VTALAEAWLLGFLLAATLGAGALAVFSAGILLQERWVEPLRPVLGAAAGAAWLLIPFALPLLPVLDRLYPWTDGAKAIAVPAAGAAILALWALLGRLLARPAPTRWRAGAALLLVALSAAIGFEDWALSRDPGWVGSLHGIALMVGGAAAVLSLAVLGRGEPKDLTARTGLERALLTLGIFALWLWFVQFLTVWAADLPAEAAWYLRRQEGGWFWLKAAVAVPALLGAIALSALPQWRPWRMRLVCALLVVQHAALVLWTVRPDAPLAPGAALGQPSAVADVIVIGLLGIVLLLAGRAARRRAENPV